MPASKCTVNEIFEIDTLDVAFEEKKYEENMKNHSEAFIWFDSIQNSMDERLNEWNGMPATVFYRYRAFHSSKHHIQIFSNASLILILYIDRYICIVEESLRKNSKHSNNINMF